MRAKLSKLVVEKAEARSARYTSWDSELRDFGVKVQPTGKKCYFVYYRTASGQQRKPAVGLHGKITAEEARQIAKRWVGVALAGQDLSGERKEARTAPLVRELSERYIEDYAKPFKKPTSVRNVAGSLINALSIRYPVVSRLVGDGFFRAMCGQFVDAFPPCSPVLIAYGCKLAPFIQSFGPAATLPYLADVARLESAVWTAYHAADAEPLMPQAFAGVRSGLAHRARLRFTPSTSVVVSRWPIVSIWETNARDAAVRPIALDAAECALVTRPGLEVGVRRLTPPVARFIASIGAGVTLELAVRSAFDLAPNFEPLEGLSILMTVGIVSEIEVAAPGLSPELPTKVAPM